MMRIKEKSKNLPVKKKKTKDNLRSFKKTLFILFFPISWFLLPSSYFYEWKN